MSTVDSVLIIGYGGLNNPKGGCQTGNTNMQETYLYNVVCILSNGDDKFPASRTVATDSEVEARILAVENMRESFPDHEIEVNKVKRTMLRVVVE